MPAAIATRTEVLDRLMESFRRDGYDGASLATLSERTGLGKSSLYHHFPGGKEEMALAVLDHLNAGLRETFERAEAEANPKKKLVILLDAVDTLYDGGKKACLLARLGASVDRARFSAALKAAFGGLMSTLAGICRADGMTAAEARNRAESAVVRIEGALVVAAGVGDPGVFKRALRELGATMLLPKSRRGK